MCQCCVGGWMHARYTTGRTSLDRTSLDRARCGPWAEPGPNRLVRWCCVDEDLREKRTWIISWGGSVPLLSMMGMFVRMLGTSMHEFQNRKRNTHIHTHTHTHIHTYIHIYIHTLISLVIVSLASIIVCRNHTFCTF